MLQFLELKQQLRGYLSVFQVKEITKAYDLAEKLHHGQVRSDGAPYITHPLEVAKILADMRMDYQSIVAAILHDVLEDTSISKEELSEMFHANIVALVDGVSKLEQLKFETREEAQAENLRKGEVAVPCNLQPAIAGLNSVTRPVFVSPAESSGVEDWVPRNKDL